MTGSRRLGQVIRLRPEHRQVYLELHARPWPTVMERLRRSHIGHYSIYEYGELLFATFEYSGDDWDTDMAAIAADPATREWWALTDPCQERLPSTPAGEQWLTLPEIFRLPEEG